MNTQETQISKGKAKWQHIRNGVVIDESGWISNVITNAGKAAEAGLISGVGGVAAFTYLAIGTSATTPTAADTALNAELSVDGLARHAATVTLITTSVANDTLQLNYLWTASNSHTIQEAGIFNDPTTGTMLGHLLTGAKSVVSGDQFNFTYTVQLS